jgi:hypothetical protein
MQSIRPRSVFTGDYRDPGDRNQKVCPNLQLFQSGYSGSEISFRTSAAVVQKVHPNRHFFAWSLSPPKMMEDPHYKVVMLGDSGVGKTALVNRISEGVFTDSHVPTVGSQFIALPLDLGGKKLTLELWDTAGQEVYRSLVGFYTREAIGFANKVDLDAQRVVSSDVIRDFVRAQGIEIIEGRGGWSVCKAGDRPTENHSNSGDQPFQHSTARQMATVFTIMITRQCTHARDWDQLAHDRS